MGYTWARELASVFFLYKSPSMFYVWFITKENTMPGTMKSYGTVMKKSKKKTMKKPTNIVGKKVKKKKSKGTMNG